MERKSIYVAFSNQKGGVGKSAFTTLAASYLHYEGKRNVVVIDCDYPQHSIFAMRERDKSMVSAIGYTLDRYDLFIPVIDSDIDFVNFTVNRPCMVAFTIYPSRTRIPQFWVGIQFA